MRLQRKVKPLLKTHLLKLLLLAMLAMAVQVTPAMVVPVPSEDITPTLLLRCKITKKQFLPVCDQSHE